MSFILTPLSCGLSLSTGKVQIKHAALWIVGEMGVRECDQVCKMVEGLKSSLHYNTLQPLSVRVLISARRRRMRREGDKEEKEALRFEALMESDGENPILVRATRRN